MAVNRRAERRCLVALMAEQGRGVDDMASEVADRERCGMLAAYRLVQDLSQEGATDRYNDLLGVHTGDPGFLSRQRIGKLEAWPHSHVTPTLPELVNLARLYGTEPRRLVRPDDLGRLSPSVRTALSHAGSAAHSGRTLEPPTTAGADEVDDMHRRELLNLFAAAGIGDSLLLDSIEALRGVLTRAAAVPDALAEWRIVAAQYTATVPTAPEKARALPAAGELRELVHA